MEKILHYPIENGFTFEIEGMGFIDCKVFGDILIWDCYTNHEARRQGVFKILLNEVISKNSDKKIYAAVTNKKIIPYIESIGFKEVDEEIPYWGHPANCKIFKLNKIL